MHWSGFAAERFGNVFTGLPIAGSLFNAGMIVLGTMIGLPIGDRLPKRVTDSLMSSIGVFVIYLGLGMANTSTALLTTLFAFVGGTAIGEILNIHTSLERLGEWMKTRLRMKDARFGEAFITVSLIFCTGSLAILGSIEEGLGHFPAMLITKSLIDGASSMVFAISLGVGTAFAALSVLVYQGSITLVASAAESIVQQPTVDAMTSVGGLMVVCIGLDLLGVAKIRTGNQLPGIVLAALITLFVR